MEVLRRPGVLLAVVACRRKFLRISGPYSPRVSAEGQEQVLPRPTFCILTRIQKPVLTVALRSHLVQLSIDERRRSGACSDYESDSAGALAAGASEEVVSVVTEFR